jgi:UDP-N-acetylmuramoylalanine--D-glutamate ligase
MKNKNWNEEVLSEQDMFNSLLELRRQILEESVSDVQSTRHRQELIGTWNDIEFINDSKATNVDLTWYSLERLQGIAVWIVGGLQAGQDYSMLKELVADKVRAVVCLGRENGDVFKTFLTDADVIVGASTADEAVKAAATLARPGDKVILSPACASHDLFDTYEDRGDQFTKAVLRMINN